jgi:hypothetical protein
MRYVVWRRPDETRLYSTLLMVSHPENCLFCLIINNMNGPTSPFYLQKWHTTG